MIPVRSITVTLRPTSAFASKETTILASFFRNFPIFVQLEYSILESFQEFLCNYDRERTTKCFMKIVAFRSRAILTLARAKRHIRTHERRAKGKKENERGLCDKRVIVQAERRLRRVGGEKDNLTIHDVK